MKLRSGDAVTAKSSKLRRLLRSKFLAADSAQGAASLQGSPGVRSHKVSMCEVLTAVAVPVSQDCEVGAHASWPYGSCDLSENAGGGRSFATQVTCPGSDVSCVASLARK